MNTFPTEMSQSKALEMLFYKIIKISRQNDVDRPICSEKARSRLWILARGSQVPAGLPTSTRPAPPRGFKASGPGWSVLPRTRSAQ